MRAHSVNRCRADVENALYPVSMAGLDYVLYSPDVDCLTGRGIIAHIGDCNDNYTSISDGLTQVFSTTRDIRDSNMPEIVSIHPRNRVDFSLHRDQCPMDCGPDESGPPITTYSESLYMESTVRCDRFILPDCYLDLIRPDPCG